MTMLQDLFNTAVGNGVKIDIPDADLFYIEDFIPEAERIYEQLTQEIAWRQDTITLYGKSVLIPRLNAWYGDANARYGYSGIQLDPQPWTPTLASIKQRLESEVGASFNSVLVNLYRDGRDSVAWHSDDEVELGPEPSIASISLGASRRFSLRHRRQRQYPVQHLMLTSGSLLVMRGATQRFWHHQVAKDPAVTAGRINLTFRQIIPATN